MKITEEEIRKLTLEAIEELGGEISPDLVKNRVQESVEKLGSLPDDSSNADITSGKVILTSFGVNHPGIIYNITKSLSEFKCDIRDLSQKIMDEFYTMIMIIDISNSPQDLKDIQTEMTRVAKELKVKIYLQHEDVFRYMHRI